MTDKKKHAALALLLALLGLFGGASSPGSGSGSGNGSDSPTENESGNESTNENESGDESGNEESNENESGNESGSEDPVLPNDPADEEEDTNDDRYDPDPERKRNEIIGGAPEDSEYDLPDIEIPSWLSEHITAENIAGAGALATGIIAAIKSAGPVALSRAAAGGMVIHRDGPIGRRIRQKLSVDSLYDEPTQADYEGSPAQWIDENTPFEVGPPPSQDEEDEEDEEDDDGGNDTPTYTPPNDPPDPVDEPGDTVGGGPGGVVVR